MKHERYLHRKRAPISQLEFNLPPLGLRERIQIESPWWPHTSVPRGDPPTHAERLGGSTPTVNVKKY